MRRHRSDVGLTTLSPFKCRPYQKHIHIGLKNVFETSLPGLFLTASSNWEILAIRNMLAGKRTERYRSFHLGLGPDYMRRGGPVNGLARKTGQPASLVYCMLSGS